MLTDGQLQAYIDGELDASDVAAVESALGADPAARQRLEAIQQAAALFSDAVGHVDGADSVPPPVAAPGARKPASPRPFGLASLARAAALILAVAGVASAVIPGTPVNDWVRDLWSDSQPVDAALPSASPVPEVLESPGTVEEADPTSITIRPSEGEVTVRIPAIDGTRTVRLTALLTAEPEARLSTSGDAPPRYAVAAGTIEVQGDLPDELVVEIPRWVEVATVWVGDIVVLRKRGSGFAITAGARALAPGLEIQLAR